MPGDTINGQDVLAVYQAVHDAVKATRDTSRPRLLECETYRYSGHFSGEKALLKDRPYRDIEEIKRMKNDHDPLSTFRAAILEASVFDETTLTEIDEAVEAEIADAADYARDSDRPDGDRAPAQTYANQSYPGFPAEKY